MNFWTSSRQRKVVVAVVGGAVWSMGCASQTAGPNGSSTESRNGATLSTAGQVVIPSKTPTVERMDPFAGRSDVVPTGLAALRAELQRAMTELGGKAQPPPYFLSYEVFDRDETVISASYGALVQSSSRRTRLLDTDVRVGTYQLDSTHPLRTDAFDFGGDGGGERAVSLPFADDAAVIRAVAWLDTDRKYKAAAEAFVKIRTQRSLKTAEEDSSDDFSREKPVTFIAPIGRVGLTDVDKDRWEQRVRLLSARFRGHPRIHDSQVTLQVSTVNR
ncbi:MAG: hypothetical protein H7X95_12235, partial [Deltaproteobacteria bacterium]|nr:hypothetical protein [Deltaproteobacteria bacterium]